MDIKQSISPITNVYLGINVVIRNTKYFDICGVNSRATLQDVSTDMPMSHVKSYTHKEKDNTSSSQTPSLPISYPHSAAPCLHSVVVQRVFWNSQTIHQSRITQCAKCTRAQEAPPQRHLGRPLQWHIWKLYGFRQWTVDQYASTGKAHCQKMSVTLTFELTTLKMSSVSCEPGNE